MNKTIALVTLLLLGVGASAYAEDVTGVLVDKACYTKDKANVTNAHKGMDAACAQACAKNGNTVALLTEKGDLIDVVPTGGLAGEQGAANAKLVPHMSHTVTLTGDVMDMKGTKMIHATALKMISK
jgi:hypothetical protein